VRIGNLSVGFPCKIFTHRISAGGLTIHSSRTRIVAAIFQGKSVIPIGATMHVGLIQVLDARSIGNEIGNLAARWSMLAGVAATRTLSRPVRLSP
jgi:hypothetical protein